MGAMEAMPMIPEGLTDLGNGLFIDENGNTVQGLDSTDLYCKSNM